MKLKRRLAITFLICFLCVLIAACTSVAFAYFTKKQTYEGYFSGQVELLFDRLDNDGITAYQEALRAEGDTTTTVNETKKWGSKAYPFVISDVRHLYNLSELQKLGYFEKRFLNKDANGNYIPNDKDEDGNYIENEADRKYYMPYFLVCTPQYTPALIDGEHFRSIYTIGTEQYPFIGSVKGVKNTNAAVTDEQHGKTYDTSAIHNVTVSCDSNNIDAGLFGVIGYLGDPSTATDGAFVGQVSTVSNLVLSDVQIVVESKSLMQTVIDKFKEHVFSFNELTDPNEQKKVPHENHHIGILAGHAEYAKIEFISVYYSSDNVVAINLADKTQVDGKDPNYLSATGILGFINNLNPETVVDADGNQSITAGSGDSMGNISYSPVGGGGAGSGEHAGYVLAEEMYETFHYTGTPGNTVAETDGTIYIKDAVDINGKPLCSEWVRTTLFGGTQRTDRYYFYDGVFTFALSSIYDEIEPTWDVVKDDNNNPVLDNGNLTYDVPDFSIGSLTDDNKWEPHSKDNLVVIFIEKITTDSQLRSLGENDRIFITQQNNADLLLMDLYNGSITNENANSFSTKYTTLGTGVQLGDNEYISKLIELYRSGSRIPDYLKEKYDGLKDPVGSTTFTEALGQLSTDLKNNNSALKAINVGITSAETPLSVLRDQYQIKSTETGNYRYFSGNTPVEVNADGTIQQYYDYSSTDYDGYFFYEEETTEEIFWTRTDYTYYWQSKDGTVIQILNKRRNAPNTYFNEDNLNAKTWEGEFVYTYTYNGTPYTGVLVNKTKGTFYNTGVTADANSTTLTKSASKQFFDYHDSKYSGYIYYTEESGWNNTTYTYYWQTKDGTVSTLIEGSSNNPDSYIKDKTIVATADKWHDETVYTYKDSNNNEYTGVFINKSNNTFYGSGTTANITGPTLTKSIDYTEKLYYLYNEVTTATEADKEYYLWSDSAGTGTEYKLVNENNTLILKDSSNNSYKQDGTSPSGKPEYKIGDTHYVLLDRYPTYTFSNGNNFMRMIQASFSRVGDYYVLWNGPQSKVVQENFKHDFGGWFSGTKTPDSVTDSTEATLRFNTDGTCYIQYSIGSTGLYVNSTGTAFNTASSNSNNSTKLSIYKVQVMQTINYGRIVFDPIDDPNSKTDSMSFSAGQYVLQAGHPTNTSGTVDANTTTYTVKPLKNMPDPNDSTKQIAGLNWNNGVGVTLSQKDLESKFLLTRGITFGLTFGLGDFSISTEGIVTAPVGTQGVEANIPQGCIAFRMNKAVENAKIRVIIAVAASKLHPGETGYDLGTHTRYFNCWKLGEAGDSIVESFSPTSNVVDRFIVPRSHPYIPDTLPGDAEYITVNYNGTDYRCYLNGDRVLIAYEFTVNSTESGTGTGIYCLGMSGIDSNGDTVNNVPMEILYFSADGAASSGRDGANGSQLGTIDFVYDYTDANNITKIVTVTENSSTNTDGIEDYSTYYPSYSLLYFDVTQPASDSTEDNPTFIPVNNAIVKIRRYVVAVDADNPPKSDANHNTTKSLSTLFYEFTTTTTNEQNEEVVVDSELVKIAQYAILADNVYPMPSPDTTTTG